MKLSRREAKIGLQCVACGNCVNVCPIGAVYINKGMYAVTDNKKCVGCGKCATACPASVISIVEREEAVNEAEALV